MQESENSYLAQANSGIFPILTLCRTNIPKSLIRLYGLLCAEHIYQSPLSEHKSHIRLYGLISDCTAYFVRNIYTKVPSQIVLLTSCRTYIPKSLIRTYIPKSHIRLYGLLRAEHIYQSPLSEHIYQSPLSEHIYQSPIFRLYGFAG